jgi:acetoin utilization deacetylase AcuC-like enzyme
MLKIAFDPIYRHQLKIGHRFPMEKYELLPEYLLRMNICNRNNFFSPLPIEKKLLLSTHDEGYYNNLINLSLSKLDARHIGFPLSEALIKREHVIAQGTIQNTHYAQLHGISMNIAGGTHHAFRDRPGAFCMLNDQAIASNYLINNNLAKRVMIVDLDVHQGDGTASIFEHQDSVFTISFHGQKNYPFKKQNSDFDLTFDDNTKDEAYLNALKNHLPRLVDLFEPDFMFYLAGVDVLKTDKLGRLALSMEGCKARDRFVLTLCRDQNIPVQVSMGGGYSVQINDIIDAHSNTFELAQELFF